MPGDDVTGKAPEFGGRIGAAPASWHTKGTTRRCWTIDDLDATCERIEAAGITLLSEPRLVLTITAGPSLKIRMATAFN